MDKWSVSSYHVYYFNIFAPYPGVQRASHYSSFVVFPTTHEIPGNDNSNNTALLLFMFQFILNNCIKSDSKVTCCPNANSELLLKQVSFHSTDVICSRWESCPFFSIWLSTMYIIQISWDKLYVVYVCLIIWLEKVGRRRLCKNRPVKILLYFVATVHSNYYFGAVCTFWVKVWCFPTM